MPQPQWIDHAGVGTLHFPFLERFGVSAYFTGREGGVSQRYPGGLNWSVSIGDAPEWVHENRVRSLAPAGLGPKQMAIAGLVHGADVALVTEPATPVPEVDGLVTERQGLALVVTAADCVPVYLVDPVSPAIGLVHAGWRGTVARAASAAVQRLAAAFGSAPARLWAVVGPSIGPCCYEVDRHVTEPLRERFGSAAERCLRPGARPDRWMLDLWEANRADLLAAGLPPEQIQVAGACTSCRVDRFFSHRAEQGQAGRGAAVLVLKESVCI